MNIAVTSSRLNWSSPEQQLSVDGLILCNFVACVW